MMGNMAGLAGLAGMMGGGMPEGGLELPPLNVPCAVCTVKLERAALAAVDGDTPPAARSVTAVLGTPVCIEHARELLDAILSNGSRN